VEQRLSADPARYEFHYVSVAAVLSRIWKRNSMLNLYTTTKGMTMICVHRLVDKWFLDLGHKISHYLSDPRSR